MTNWSPNRPDKVVSLDTVAPSELLYLSTALFKQYIAVTLPDDSMMH